MNNDLISREALKKALKEYKYCGFYDKVIEIIDNAPTVEPTESELVKAYTKGFDTGVEIVKNARLQGEWLFVSRNCWKCPYCQELTNEGKNFCPNCGAYMRGENNG